MQGIRGQFMTGHGPRMELLADLPDSDTLQPWLDMGVKMYHLGYLVENMKSSIDALTSAGAHVIARPVAATAFGRGEIAFLMLRNMLVVELIQLNAQVFS